MSLSSQAADLPTEAGLPSAMRLFRAGETARAAALLEPLLADAPDDGRCVLLLGLVRAEEGALAAAEEQFTRAVALGAEEDFALHMLGELRKRQDDHAGAASFYRRAIAARPDFAAHFNALGIALQRLGQHDAALDAFDGAIRLDPAYGTAICNRGLLFEAMHREEAAAASFKHVLALTPGTAADWHTRGLACFRLRAFEAGLAAIRAALARDPSNLNAHLLLAETLERLHRFPEADRARAELGRRQRVVRQPCFATQPQARVLLVAGSGSCNIPTHYVLDRNRFEVTLVHLAPHAGDAENAALLGQLPPFDVAFNVIGDADLGAPFLRQAASFCAPLGCPVLNPPGRVPSTRRDRLPALLGDIPELVVPDIQRRNRPALDVLAADGAPWPRARLIRPAGSHGGPALRRLDPPPTLAAYLAEVPAAEYYVSDFRDYRSADGLFRKARFIFVGGAVFPYHLAICRGWLAHYWRADMTAALRAEEAAFLADPTCLFPASAMSAIRETAARLDLDFGGIDCAPLPDGRVLLFEANATMLVHIAGLTGEDDYQHAHVPRIRQALSEMVLERLAAGVPS